MEHKRIFMVGVFDVAGSTNIAMAEGFRSLGHIVEEFNYRTEISVRGLTSMHERLYALIEFRKFDLIIFCKTNQIDPYVLHRAEVSGPTWYWFMDNFAACRQLNAASYAANATHASATASDVADRFKMVNKNAHHVFEGFNSKIYYHEDLKKIYEYLFIGNATVPRIIKIQEMIRSGMDITIFGYGWPVGMRVNPPVVDEDERTEINSAKVVLNLCHDNVIFSDRVIKSLACGANVLSENCADLRKMVSGLTSNPAQAENVGMTDAEWIAVVNDKTNMIDVKNSHTYVFKAMDCIEELMLKKHSWEAVARDILEKGAR